MFSNYLLPAALAAGTGIDPTDRALAPFYPG